MLIIGVARNQNGRGAKTGSYYEYCTDNPEMLSDGQVKSAPKVLGFDPEAILMVGVVDGEPAIVDIWNKR